MEKQCISSLSLEELAHLTDHAAQLFQAQG